MNLQERIRKISPYFKSFEYINNYVLVKVEYKKGWNVMPSDNSVMISKDENNSNLYYYYLDVNDNYDLIFDSIDKTISFNTESEIKIKLLKDKIEELRQIFLDNDIDTLKTIKFSFRKKRRKNNSEAIKDMDNNE